MVDPTCGLFPPENVKLLLDEQATTDNVRRALSALRKVCGPDDTAWVYFAGHGAPEESDLFWVTHDTDVNDLYGSGLSSHQIDDALGRIKAGRLLVFLDCCHAAACTCQTNPTRDVLTPERLLAAYAGKGRLTFTSSDGAEKSVELPEHGHGAFTYFLARGLKGEADRAGDGVVTASELWDYLRGKVADASRNAGCPQTPMLDGQMSHDLALTLNPAAALERKRVADAITKMVGMGEDRLATEEAEFCLDLLARGPRNAEERSLIAEFDAVTSGALAPRTFKALVRAARRPGNTDDAKPLGGNSGPRTEADRKPTTGNNTLPKDTVDLEAILKRKEQDEAQARAETQKREREAAEARKREIDARFEKLKVTLADQLGRNAYADANRTVAEMLRLKPGDAEARRTRTFLNKHVRRGKGRKIALVLLFLVVGGVVGTVIIVKQKQARDEYWSNHARETERQGQQDAERRAAQTASQEESARLQRQEKERLDAALAEAARIEALKPKAIFESIQLEYSAQQAGRQGMVVHAKKLEVKNLKDVPISINAYFFAGDGTTKIFHTPGEFATVDGQMCVSSRVTVPYDDATWADFPLFFPYDGFELPAGKHDLKVYIEVHTPSGEAVGRTDMAAFVYTTPARTDDFLEKLKALQNQRDDFKDLPDDPLKTRFRNNYK